MLKLLETLVLSDLACQERTSLIELDYNEGRDLTNIETVDTK